MPTLTKAVMAERLTDEIGFNKRESRELVETFFNELGSCLVKGEEIKISGFGNFNTRDKKERPGRNPKTGVETVINARRVVTFKPGQTLKLRVASYSDKASA